MASSASAVESSTRRSRNLASLLPWVVMTDSNRVAAAGLPNRTSFRTAVTVLECRPRRGAGRGPRQGEIHGCALTLAAVGPYLAAMTGHDPVHDGQPDAGTFELIRGMQTLEDAEELLRIAHVEARAVVAHVVHRLISLTERPELDAGRIPAAAEFKRIGEQIDQYLLNQRRIAPAVGELPDLNHGRRAGARGGEPGEDLQSQRAQRHAQALERRAAHAREMQQVIDELAHASRSGPDSLQQLLAIGRHGGG